MADLTKLNKEQKEAVEHGAGPMLIVAGAGTGKTKVITQRIINLIEKGSAQPEEILAVTFTEKAASEMEERVDKLLDYGYVDLWISTFHSFCERVLRDNALDIGLPPDFKIVDQTSSWLLAKQNLDKFELDYYKSLGNPAKFIQALIYHFSHCKDQEVYPENYLEYSESLKTRDDAPEDEETERIKEVANLYHTYQQILLEKSSLDFGDLINYCLKLFKKRPAILKKYRDKFKYILVDEFQDTNHSQYDLIKILAEPANNLTVCADDDQAIYRWRGASFSNIMDFKTDFPNAKQVSLVKNYRSSQNILDKSHEFIKLNNPDRMEAINNIDKKLIAQTEEKGIVEHLAFKSIDEEAREVVKKIAELKKKDNPPTGGTSYNDFAILVRANDTAVPFIRELEKAGLPYQFLASRGLYSKPIILDVISYFKLLDNYHESSALYRILNLPFLNIPDDDIMRLTQTSHKKTISLYETLEQSPKEEFIQLLSLIKKHTLMAREKNVSEILEAFLKDSGYMKFLVDEDDLEKWGVLNQFLKRIKTFEESTIEPTLKNFISELTMELESGEEGKLAFDPNLGPEMIRVMTIHAAKGLEFKYVFLVSMVDRKFPTTERKDPIELPEALIKDRKPSGDAHLQEERRICYVAMTRAKKGLFFTSAADYGGVRKKKLSRFLQEMGYNNADDKNEAYENELLAEKIKVPQSKKMIDSELLPKHFSFSQLAAFEKCPYQYKLAFISKVPIRGKAVFSFGKTMHGTLHQYLQELNQPLVARQDNLFGFPSKNEKNGKAETNNASLEKMYELYDKNWIDEWYESKTQKDDYYKNGKRILRELFLQFKKNPPKIATIDNKLALEISFTLKIGDYNFFGIIDRIDETPEGIKILDYKTGQPKEKLEAEDKAQLLIYQIAAEEVYKIKPSGLAYCYLEDGSQKSFLGTDLEKQERKNKIINQIEAIKRGDFTATPGWQCQYCDFKDICDHAQR